MNATFIDAGPQRGPRARIQAGVGRKLLSGSPRQVLARLTAGDPLAIAERVSRYLAAQRLLMDEHRVTLRSLAFIARASAHYRGRPGFARWLDQQVGRAVTQLEEGQLAGLAGERWSKLAASFQLSTLELDRACAGFHGLPFEARDSFFALVLEGRPIDSLVYPGGRSAVEIAADARRALEIFLGLGPQSNSTEVCL